MKINYPIVYALMPIKEQVGWSHGLNELEREYGVVCYIVSKCYLVGEKTRYKDDGKTKTVYEIVFPYQKNNYNWEYEEPSYNLLNGECTNSDYVDVIFDSYEMALEYKDKMNQEICKKMCSYLPFNENFQEEVYKKEKEFCDKLKKYELLEKQFQTNMYELDGGKRKELDYVVKSDGNILSTNLYQFMSFFNNSKYLVYSITKEEYDYIVNQSDEERKIKLNSSKPLLLCDSTISKLVNDESKGCYYFDNDWLRYSEKISPVSISEIENISKDTIIVYTTEAVKDIIDSYKKYDEIDLSKLEKKDHEQVKKLIKN